MKLKDIVEQVEATPSPRCWESIASQLPAAGTLIGGSAATTVAKGALSAGKLAAIIGSSVAVVAVITGTTIALLTQKSSIEQQLVNQSNTTVTLTDSTAVENQANTETTLLLCQAETEQRSPSKENTAASTSSISSKPIIEEASATTPTTNTSNSSASPKNVTLSPNMLVSNQNSITTSSSNSTSTPTSSNTPDHNSNNQTPASIDNANSDPKNNQDNNIALNGQNEEWSFSQPVIIEIPNIFTPNGDGVNDLFVVKGIENCEKKILMIKDKSGQTVFQSNHYDNSWDGGNLPDGTYYYQFSYSINNINELRKGAVLIRR